MLWQLCFGNLEGQDFAKITFINPLKAPTTQTLKHTQTIRF